MNKFIKLFLIILMPLAIAAKSVHELLPYQRSLSTWLGNNRFSMYDITDYKGIEDLEIGYSHEVCGYRYIEKCLLLDFPDLFLEIGFLDIPHDKKCPLMFPIGIEKLTNILSIELSSCGLGHSSKQQIMQLFKELARLPKIQELNLSHNASLILSADLAELASVSKIDLSDNKLGKSTKEQVRQLFEYLGKLPNLKELDLSYNDLDFLPNEIEKLTHLTVLRLNNNKLKAIPKEISKLTNLTELELGHNNLGKLPDSIGCLTQLKTLDLHGNNISSLPKELGNLKALVNLTLFGNKFRSKPKVIQNLPNLNKRSLNGEDW